MNFRDYRSITINGHLLNGNDIIEFCRRQTGKNMLVLAEFMVQWLSDDGRITARTSGSTGPPKEIMISKNQMLESAALTARFFGFQKGQNALLCLPVGYIAGKMMAVRAMFSGLNLICIEPGSSPLEHVPKGIQIDFAPLVPLQLDGVSDTSFIKTILLGGAPVSPGQELGYQSLKTEIYQSYGMTETLSHIAIRRINGDNRSEIYRALPGVSFDVDDERCLLIDVPFLNDRVHTSDVVELLNDHEFIWKGRADNVVNSGGIKLFPEEIERKLQMVIPERFFFAGLPDERFGEKLCLFIEGKSYGDENFQKLLDSFKTHLDTYEKPRDIFFIEHFQMTGSGKIMRNRIVSSVL